MNFRNNSLRVAVILVIEVFFFSCSKDETILIPPSITELPDDITKLYFEKGNTNSNKVILYCIGGPDNSLNTKYFDDFGFSEFHEVYVHQSNTYNQDIIIGLNEDLTFERAIKEDLVSVEMLRKVAKHFKDQGKEVYIVGHSFGAILIPSLIANDDDNLAMKYLIMAGRLNFPDIVWQGFRDRQGYYFDEGITPTIRNYPPNISDVDKKESYARLRLQAGFGKNRYIQMLKNKSLTNVIYAFGEKDEAVGRLTTEEVDFLNNNGAKVYMVSNGSHGSMFDPPHKENLKVLLFNNISSKK